MFLLFFLYLRLFFLLNSIFTLMPLFLDLLDNGIMATKTLKANWKYIPRVLFAKKTTVMQDMGWIDYCMQWCTKKKNVCSVVWKDKKAVFSFPINAKAILPLRAKQFVMRKIGKKKKKANTSPMLLQNIRNINTTNQLKGNYSCLICSCKWWHWIFFFLLDAIIVNTWMIQSDVSFRLLKKPQV